MKTIACVAGVTAVAVVAAGAAIPRTAAVYFDHLYVVVDSQTAAAAAGSVFLRDTLGAFATRTTVSGDRTWTSGVLSGERTYIELFSPDAGFGAVGSSGLALSVEVPGTLDDLSHAVTRIPGAAPRVVARSGVMAGKEVKWFRALHLDYPARTTGRIARWVMEYEPEFVAELLGRDAAADRADLRRRLRSRRYDPTRRLLDVIAIELAADSAELARLAQELQLYGWSLSAAAPGTFSAHGDGASITGVEGGAAGITAVVLKLRPGMRLHGTRTIGSSEIRILSDTLARWAIRQ